MGNKAGFTKNFTRGGQIIQNNWRMFKQVISGVLVVSFISFFAVVAILLWMWLSHDTWQATYYYFLAKFLSIFYFDDYVFHFLWHGQVINIDANGVLHQLYFQGQVAEFFRVVPRAIRISVPISIILGILVSYLLELRGKRQGKKQHIRGARLVGPKEFSKAVKKVGASDISIASVPMVKNFETQHVAIQGTTGSGKGQIFNQFIEQIRARGDSAIIYDKGCVFTSIFYDQGTDSILNPFDERCAHWDLWKEARTKPDFDNIAASLIPMHGDADPYWVDAARTVFSSVAYRMRKDRDPSIEKLLSLILTAELDVLGDYLKGTEAATLVSGKIEKTAISIRSVISTYLKSLGFMVGLDNGVSFSVRDWITRKADTQESNFLFISSNSSQHESLKPLISMWLSVACVSLLSLEESHDRRIWFICDELPSLHKLPFLGFAISEVRKFGGCFVIGMQGRSQIKKVYGQDGSSEIINNTNTSFYLREPAAAEAEFVSKQLGMEDIEQSNESYSYGANAIRDGISVGTHRVTRPLVSAAEIMEMPNLQAYLRVPAQVPVTKIDFEYVEKPKVASGFLPRNIPDTGEERDSKEKVNSKPGDSHLDSEEDEDNVASPKTSERPEEVADSTEPAAQSLTAEDKIREEEEKTHADQVVKVNEEEMIIDPKNDREYDTFL